MPAHGPTSWCPLAPSPRARRQKKLTALSAPGTLTARSGQASTRSSRSVMGRLLRSTTGLIWRMVLATGNGYDVSHLRWMGGKTYAEIVHGLLADCPGFLAAAGLRFRRDFLCEGDTRLDFKYLDRGLCYTIGIRHPNFHPMTADPLGVWNI